MLLGAAFMIALVRDGRDDAGLVIMPAGGRDVGETAQLGARPSAATARRARNAPVREPEFSDALARGPMRTDATTR